MRPGTVLFVPAATGIGAAAAANLIAEGPAIRPVVVVPSQAFSYPDRRRVFYRAIPGDTLRDLANIFSVTGDELCRWNGVDPSAALHDGMTLQVYLPKGASIEGVLVLEERDARILASGSPEFFSHFEALKGRKRVEMVAREGDTWRSVAARHGLTVGTVERINQRARTAPLHEGDRYVVYVSSAREAAPPVSEPVAGEDVAVASNPDVTEKEPDATMKEPDATMKEEDAVNPALLLEPAVAN